MDLKQIEKYEIMKHEEWLVLQVELHIKEIMEEKGVNQAKLAQRLGVGESCVSQDLDGKNLTLRKIARIMMALDSTMVVNTADLGFVTTFEPIPTPSTNWIKLSEQKPHELQESRIEPLNGHLKQFAKKPYLQDEEQGEPNKQLQVYHTAG